MAGKILIIIGDSPSSSIEAVSLTACTQEGVKLPPEPPGHCSKELQVTSPFISSKGHVTRHVANSCQERLNFSSSEDFKI